MTIMKKSKSVNHGIIMQAMLSQHDQISEFFLIGSMDMNRINFSIETLNKAGNEVYPMLQQSLTKSIMKALKKRKEEGDAEE